MVPIESGVKSFLEDDFEKLGLLLLNLVIPKSDILAFHLSSNKILCDLRSLQQSIRDCPYDYENGIPVDDWRGGLVQEIDSLGRLAC